LLHTLDLELKFQLLCMQLVANMEASAREARAKASEGSKLLDKVAPAKDVWGSEVSEDIQLDKVPPGCI